jgi:shikimate kinase
VTPHANIYLVGLMGAGKTTVGRHLAKQMHRRFLDCDHEIESRTGVGIPTIFEIEGEAGFRLREKQMLAELAQETDLVLATGGGVVLAPENRQLLRETGTVVYLYASPEVLHARTRHDRNRPLLQVADPHGKLVELFQQRDPFYRELAHIVIEGRIGGAAALAEQIEQEIQARCEP